MKLRSHLIVLVVATLLPVVVFTLVLVVMVHREQRATAQRGLLETARALAVALDGELRGYIRTLEALADSEHLDSRDLRRFYDVAARARRHHPDWETVLLVAQSGQQLINLRRPFGAPLPDTPGNDAAFREVMHSGHPVITGIYPGPVAGHPVVGIRVPVVRDGRAQFMLSAGIAPESFARILSRQRLPGDWTAAVVDQNKVIVARNRAEERYVGRPVTADLQRAIDEMGEGSVVARNQEGAPTYAGFSRSAMAGWTVVLGRPAAEVDAALARSLWAVLGAGAAVLALGVGVAVVLGRRIAAPIARLSEAAGAISAGDVPPARSGSAVAEIDGVGAALDRAGRLVHEQAAELRAREQHLRLVTDAVPVLISYIDLEGRYVFNNRGYEEWFGHRREALRGRAVREVLGEAAFEAVRPHLDAARAGQEATFEARFPHRDGSTRHVQATFVPDRGAEGRVRGLISLVRDVTGERAAAAQLREQAETLETVNRVGQLLSGELDLERLVHGLTDAATHLTRAAYGAFFYNVVDASGERYTLYTLAGAPRDAFTGFPMPRNTRLFAPTFRGDTVVRLDDVRADPRFARDPPYSGMPAGHLPVRSYLAVPVVSRSGEVLGGLFFGHPEPGVFRERDERLVVALAAQAAVAMDNARLYEREQRARAEAEAASRAKDEFLATLSHELRTPLNAILGWTRMLRAGQLDNPSMARALEVIDRNAVAQNQLIEDLLDVSRIVAGKLRLEPRPTALGPVVEAAVETLRPAAAAKEIALHTDLEPAVGLVLADPARLQQVVWNLVSNALKFTPRYGRVEVRLARAGEHAQIEVSDTGQGIAAEVLPHVFERFRQGDSTTTRRHGGLGLGLALARHLVEMQGGSIEARSDGEGRGAAFTVRLPLLPPEGRDRSGLSAPRPAAPLPADVAALLARVRVLVVDDDADALAMVRTVLESAGADVITAGSPADALAILADRRVDVLVSDVAMPGESGYDLIRKLRELRAGAGGAVAALAITAYGSVEDRVRLIAAGFDAYLAKPLDPTELAATVGGLAARAGRFR